MIFFDILHIKHLSNFDVPKSAIIEEILDQIVSPKYNQLGLSNFKKKYLYVNSYNAEEIKQLIHFSYRASSANFSVGCNFKFIPILNEKGELKKYPNKLHLFENSDFFGVKSEISLWNEKFFKKSLKKFLDKNLGKIQAHLNYTSSLENNIELIKKQIKSSNFEYKLHYPNQKYILAFLLAKVGEKDKAIRIMKEYLEENQIKRKELFQQLESL